MKNQILKKLNLSEINVGAYGSSEYQTNSNTFSSSSPIDNSEIAKISICTEEEYEQIILEAQETFIKWRLVPAPVRGDLVRKIGNAFRDKKSELAALISLEMGKILPESEGEVQEAIDIADFAVGLSRQLYGLSMHSERENHRMYEQWHPLGIVGVISAFNFPMAVWAWNAMIAAVCGNVTLWKPSEQTPLCAIAMNKIAEDVASKAGFPGLFSLVLDDCPRLGKRIAADQRIPLVSATGSCKMGRSVGEVVAKRLGRSLLELGGNNAIIVLKDANLDLAVRSTLFGAVGTSGQRCTSTRRILIEKSIEDKFISDLQDAYSQVRIGDPLDSNTLMGPLVNKQSVEIYKNAISAIREQGGEILCGGKVCEGMNSDCYVEPTIVKASKDLAIVQEETFAPILYVIGVENYEEAVEIQNSVQQGLSSAIFTQSMQFSERFLSQAGSDCGIANVNIGTSGAEIGGAFGGEKDTGGGRESGSDSWKQYMRRQTNTINFGNSLPLAQGIKFS